MNELISLASFEGKKTRIIEHNGERWIPAQEIGEALEYADPIKAICNLYDRNAQLLEECSVTLAVRSTDNKNYDTRVFNEEGVLLICMKSNQPKAFAFQRWAAKVLKALIKGQLSQANSELVELQRKHILALEQIAGLKVQSVRKCVPYTPAEQQRILELSLTGLGAQVIARRIGRTKGGVESHMTRHGIRRAIVAQTQLAFGVQS